MSTPAGGPGGEAPRDVAQAMDASELTASFARLDASRDDIAGVVAFLRDPRVAAHAALQKRGWITLAELMPEPRTGIQTAEAVAALNAGVLAAAVAALRTHRAEEDVQVWAGVALTSLATGFPEEVGGSGAIEATVEGMREHSDDFDVLEQGCKTLATLAGACPRNGYRGGFACALTQALYSLRFRRPEWLWGCARRGEQGDGRCERAPRGRRGGGGAGGCCVACVWHSP